MVGASDAGGKVKIMKGHLGIPEGDWPIAEYKRPVFGGNDDLMEKISEILESDR